MRKLLGSATLAALLACGAVGPASAIVTADAVIKTYADIAHAGYEDSLITAKALEKAVEALLAKPTAEDLATARTAWIAARRPYQQTEVYRFGNTIVDDWEGKVNAWPLDEGLIDYVDGSYGTESDENPFFVVNLIANKSLSVGGKTIDASSITPELLGNLHEVGEVEANVATGYHAIEFLLWGQDLNGTDGGAGKRPHTDFDKANCTGGNCGRRADYLAAATKLMISDIEEMVASWKADGKAREALMKDPAKGGLTAILTGMGSLSYGELAGERMKLGLLLHDPEEEHDCFSDNTHESHYYDTVGIQNVYNGKYTRTDGSVVEGPSISDLVKAKDASLDGALRKDLAATHAKMTILKKRAETKERYDQMIGEGNAEGNAVVQAAIDALVVQTKSIEKAVVALGLKTEVEGSDSLDNPNAVK
ncbi:MAG: peptidase [Alphaproteobacteria bacterium]|nr:peptidase [Alphaproteobacteria bacterium]